MNAPFVILHERSRFHYRIQFGLRSWNMDESVRRQCFGLALRNKDMSELSSSVATFESLKDHYNPFAEEVWVIALNAQLGVIGKQMIFRGTVDYCLIHPRDIFRFLIQSNASSFIMAHNHPSRDVLPSDADLIITRKFFKLSYLMEIPLLDHIVFSDEKYFSMADHGYMRKWKKNRLLVGAIERIV
jgi:DNA repair proteins